MVYGKYKFECFKILIDSIQLFIHLHYQVLISRPKFVFFFNFGYSWEKILNFRNSLFWKNFGNFVPGVPGIDAFKNLV